MADPAHPLTLWLARASVAFYAAAVLIAVSDRATTERKFRRWRAAWSMACVLLIVHVLAAFHFEHGWSHSAALAHTAEQTARVTGIDWGGGLYFNYAFLVLWLVDAAMLWTVASKVPSRLRRSTDLACIFMVFNATVVFGPRWWIGPVIILGLVAVQLRQRNLTGNGPDEPAT
jgi:hypothetical protein